MLMQPSLFKSTQVYSQSADSLARAGVMDGIHYNNCKRIFSAPCCCIICTVAAATTLHWLFLCVLAQHRPRPKPLHNWSLIQMLACAYMAPDWDACMHEGHTIQHNG